MIDKTCFPKFLCIALGLCLVIFLKPLRLYFPDLKIIHSDKGIPFQDHFLNSHILCKTQHFLRANCLEFVEFILKLSPIPASFLYVCLQL